MKKNWPFLLRTLGFFLLLILLFKGRALFPAPGNYYLKMGVGILNTALTIGIFLWLSRKYSPPFQRTVARQWRIMIIPVLLLAIFMILQLNLEKARELNFIQLTLVVLTCIMAGAAEEVVCRRFFLPYFYNRFRNVEQAIYMSSFIFALAHLLNVHRSGISDVVIQVLYAFFFGIILSCFYLFTKSLLFVSVFHGLVNIPSKINQHAANASIEVETLTDTILSLILSLLILVLPIALASWYYLKLARRKLQFQPAAAAGKVATPN